MEKLKKFADIADYGANVNSLETPNVCFIENENLVLYNKAEVEDNHAFVDLGLPSGLKWATVNIGAEAPEDYGMYFMWGDIVGHYPDEGYNFDWGSGYNSSTDKFDPTSNYGKCHGAELRGDIPVNKRYDAAMANWGDNWRMPTRKDFKELYECCRWDWDHYGTVYGYEITGPNENVLFLPAAGFCFGTTVSGVDSLGSFWQSTLVNVDFGSYLSFNGSSVNPDNLNNRYCGYSVRPVRNLL